MAFSLGYVSLCQKDIKNIYIHDFKPPARRKTRHYQPEFLRQQDWKRIERARNRRFMEYDARYEMELPKAPAFRTMDRERVDRVVSRLGKRSKERFNFKCHELAHAQSNEYLNDWQKIEEERRRKIQEAVKKFGGSREWRKPPARDDSEDSHHLPTVSD